MTDTSGDYGDPAREHHAKAAEVTVPAEAAIRAIPEEAVEAAATAGIHPRIFMELPTRTQNDWRATMRLALAAAAPLIVADLCERDLQLFDEQAATIDLLQGDVQRDDEMIDRLQDKTERLTAERDAALARIAAAVRLLDQIESLDELRLLRAALANDPGGSR